MKIVTPRLVLRPPAQNDAQQLYDGIMKSYDDFLPWLPWVEIYKVGGIGFARESIAEFEREWAEQTGWNFVCFADNQLVGMVGLIRPAPAEKSIEIGYWCVRDQQGKGYITEATNAVVRFAFDVLCMKKVMIICDEQNHRSAAVAHRLGFTREHVGLGTCGQAPDRICERYALTDTNTLPVLSVSFEGEMS